MGFETAPFGSQEQEPIDSENLLLARNFVQLYHAERETHIGHVSEKEDGKEGNDVLARETERLGRDFSDWLETVSGSRALEEYVRTHSSEEISRFEGMDGLIEAYEAHHARMLH